MDAFELLVEAHRPALKDVLAKLVAILRAPSPEALLWRYLVSEQEQNYVDALNLVRSNPGLDLSLVRSELERRQPELLDKLDKLLFTAQQPVGSYEESRARRG